MKGFSNSSISAIALFLLTGMMIIFLLFLPHQRLEQIKITLHDHFRKPVRRTICLTASMVDFSGRSPKYISHKEMREIKTILQPGDILFRRNEAQLTNIAISGFWTHSAIYVGGLEDINRVFGTTKLTDGKLPSDYIEEHYPLVYRKIRHHRNMIIEAIGEGVSVNPIDQFANADYFAAIRPQTDKELLFKAILRSFDYYGTQYDFFFDFQSDDALVCSELVYKSFLPVMESKGLKFRMQVFDNKPFLSPNDIVAQVSDQKESIGSLFAFVTFYGGDDAKGKAGKRSEAEFLLSSGVE